MDMLWIGIFGLVGIFARYGFDQALILKEISLPVATLTVNFLGSLVAGAIATLALDAQVISQTLRTAILVGFCGGFTTFSAYSLQSFILIEQGKIPIAITYLVLSPALGIAAVYLGVVLAKSFL